jgi:hypothetical protein
MMRDLDFLPTLPHPAEHPTRALLQLPNADRSHVHLNMATNMATSIAWVRTPVNAPPTAQTVVERAEGGRR